MAPGNLISWTISDLWLYCLVLLERKARGSPRGKPGLKSDLGERRSLWHSWLALRLGYGRSSQGQAGRHLAQVPLSSSFTLLILPQTWWNRPGSPIWIWGKKTQMILLWPWTCPSSPCCPTWLTWSVTASKRSSALPRWSQGSGKKSQTPRLS